MINPLLHINLEKITDLEARAAIIALLNAFETSLKTITELKEENQRLKNENAILKGEQGKPDIKPRNNNTDISSEENRKKIKHTKSSRRKKIEEHKINIDKLVICKLDKDELPSDVINKGYETTISQNIIFKSDNTEYRREKYYSPSLKKTYIAPLPDTYTGYIDSNLKTFCHIFHHGWDITRSKLISGLCSIGIHISDGMLNNILFEPAQIVINEKKEILKAGLLGAYTQIDGTSARFCGENYTTQIICSPDFTVFSTLLKKKPPSCIVCFTGRA